MGWFDTLLNVTSLAVDVANASQLQAMRAQGATDAQVRAFLDALKNQIFQLKRMADDTLEEEKVNPRIAAAHMKLLELRVHDSLITPDLFSELSDKDFVVSTERLILTNSNRMFQNLAPQDKAAVIQAVNAFVDHARSSQFIQNYDQAQHVKSAQAIVKTLDARNKMFPPIVFTLLYVVIILGFIAVNLFNTNTTCTILSIAGVIGTFILQNQFVHRKEYQAAKKVIESDLVDMDEYSSLEKFFNGSLQTAQGVNRTSGSVVDRFFKGESELEPGKPANDQTRQQVVQESIVPQPTLEEVYCTQCNRVIREEYIYCPYCGEHFEGGDTESAEQAQIPSSSAKRPALPVKEVDYDCIRCQKTRLIPEDADFCPYCGEKLNEVGATETESINQIPVLSTFEPETGVEKVDSGVASPPIVALPSVQKLFCAKCGNRLPAGSIFCPYCGNRQED